MSSAVGLNLLPPASRSTSGVVPSSPTSAKHESSTDTDKTNGSPKEKPNTLLATETDVNDFETEENNSSDLTSFDVDDRADSNHNSEHYDGAYFTVYMNNSLKPIRLCYCPSTRLTI